MKPHNEKLTAITTLYGWKLIPSGHKREPFDEGEAYVLTAREFTGHPLLGDGEDFRSGWVEIVDLERGFAITKSGTRYSLA